MNLSIIGKVPVRRLNCMYAGQLPHTTFPVFVGSGPSGVAGAAVSGAGSEAPGVSGAADDGLVVAPDVAGAVVAAGGEVGPDDVADGAWLCAEMPHAATSDITTSNDVSFRMSGNWGTSFWLGTHGLSL